MTRKKSGGLFQRHKIFTVIFGSLLLAVLAASVAIVQQQQTYSSRAATLDCSVSCFNFKTEKDCQISGKTWNGLKACEWVSKSYVTGDPKYKDQSLCLSVKHGQTLANRKSYKYNCADHTSDKKQINDGCGGAGEKAKDFKAGCCPNLKANEIGLCSVKASECPNGMTGFNGQCVNENQCMKSGGVSGYFGLRCCSNPNIAVGKVCP